jgi:hypothetical protein
MEYHSISSSSAPAVTTAGGPPSDRNSSSAAVDAAVVPDGSFRSREWDLIRSTGKGRTISATSAASLDKDEKYNEFCYRVFSWMQSAPAKRQKRTGGQGEEGKLLKS